MYLNNLLEVNIPVFKLLILFWIPKGKKKGKIKELFWGLVLLILFTVRVIWII